MSRDVEIAKPLTVQAPAKLETRQDAMDWLGWVMMALGRGEITPARAEAVTFGIRSWLRAHDVVTGVTKPRRSGVHFDERRVARLEQVYRAIEDR